jgi:transcriptional regulator with XRE-family HTH domain
VRLSREHKQAVYVGAMGKPKTPLGEAIAHHVKNEETTLLAFAAELGVTYQTVRNWSIGERVPREMAGVLRRKLGIPLSVVLGDDGGEDDRRPTFSPAVQSALSSVEEADRAVSEALKRLDEAVRAAAKARKELARALRRG